MIKTYNSKSFVYNSVTKTMQTEASTIAFNTTPTFKIRSERTGITKTFTFVRVIKDMNDVLMWTYFSKETGITVNIIDD